MTARITTTTGWRLWSIWSRRRVWPIRRLSMPGKKLGPKLTGGHRTASLSSCSNSRSQQLFARAAEVGYFLRHGVGLLFLLKLVQHACIAFAGVGEIEQIGTWPALVNFQTVEIVLFRLFIPALIRAKAGPTIQHRRKGFVRWILQNCLRTRHRGFSFAVILFDPQTVSQLFQD